MRLRHFNGLKNWRIGDYIRQFSIVTAGIMVTFIGSNLITDYSTEKQVHASMQLILKELENNRNNLVTFVEKHEKDRTIATYLIANKFDLNNIATDTLRKYSAFMSQLSGFRYSADALDVLKGSSLMQQIEDKDLLLSLIKTYQDFADTQQAVGEYYELKKSVIVPLVLSADDVTMDYVDTYRRSLSAVEMRNFCVITVGFFDAGYLRGQIADVDRFIERLRILVEK